MNSRSRYSRRAVLAGLCALPVAMFGAVMGAPVINCALAAASPEISAKDLQKMLAELEASSGGRLGVAASVSDGGNVLSYRGNERFPMCSTFKVLAAAAVLRDKPDILEQRIHFAKSDIQPWSPVSEKHLEDGMTVTELCAAMLQHSDNTAANLVLALLGGPEGLTSIARSFGDTTFRLDRWEVELNSAIPGDARDTTTPLAMCRTLNGLLCGNLLKAPAKKQLTDWMLGCATGVGRIPAGAPQGWRSAHKSASGENGTANDVGLLLPPSNPEQAAKAHNGKNKPLTVALYLTGSRLTGPGNDKILAQATRLVCAAEGLATPLDNMY